MSKTAKYTPGPWECETVQLKPERSAYAVVKNEKGEALFDTMNSDVAVILEDEGYRWDEPGLSNLRLAAAAPELLAVCESLIDPFRAQNSLKDIIRAAGEAVAKAKGGA